LMTWPHDFLGQPPWHADTLPHYLLTKPSSTSLADTLALAGCRIDDWVVCTGGTTSAFIDCHTDVSGFHLVLVGTVGVGIDNSGTERLSECKKEALLEAML
jgi:hypothetical protein